MKSRNFLQLIFVSFILTAPLVGQDPERFGGTRASNKMPEQLRLRTDAGRRVNAVYHVACLGRSIACTNRIFVRFWHDRLRWTPADQTALDSWNQVMRDVTDRAPARSGAPLLPNTARFHPAQAARGLIFVAAVEARSARDLHRRSRGILNGPAAARLDAAIDHFERRLEPWWDLERQRRNSMNERLQRVVERAHETGMPQMMGDVAAFLEATLTNRKLHLHAILAPEPESTDYAATQSGNHFFFEVVNAMTTEGFVHGAVHELTHYLYDSAPPEKHLQLVREFAQMRGTSLSGLYTYLNEAIAVAAQGLYSERAREQSGEEESYKHPYVEPLGVATTPLLKEAIARKRTLFSGFAKLYVAAGTAALGDKLLEPQFVLSQVLLLLTDDDLAAAYYMSMFPQASARFRTNAEVEAFPDVNVVSFVRYEELETLAAQIPNLSSLRAHKGFVYVVKRGVRANIYVLAGRDTDALVRVITKLAASKTLNGEGLLFSLD